MPITALCSYFTAEQWGNSISQAVTRSSCSPARTSSETGSRTSRPAELQATAARPDLSEPFPQPTSSRYHFLAEPVCIPTTFNTLQSHQEPRQACKAPSELVRHSAACAKGDEAATWKTVKLGGWKRSELLVSNRRNSSHSGHQQSTAAQPSLMHSFGCSSG